jgi:hypothetical protein
MGFKNLRFILKGEESNPSMPEVVEPGQATPTSIDDSRARNIEAELQRQNSFLEQLARTTPRLALPEQPAANFNTDLFTQPDQAVTRKIREVVDPVLGPLTQMTVNSSIQLARNAAATDPTLAPVFKKWGPEIEAELTSEIPPAQQPFVRANANNWMKAAKVVMANHLGEISKANRDGRDFFLESGGSGGGAPIPTEPSLNTLDDAAGLLPLSQADRENNRQAYQGDMDKVMRFFGVDSKRALERIKSERRVA